MMADGSPGACGPESTDTAGEESGPHGDGGGGLRESLHLKVGGPTLRSNPAT